MAMTDDSGPLILIVDDNEQNAKLARDVLRAAGFRTIGAASGAEAVAQARAAQPVVILMDIRLPDMDGGDAARQLKADARTQWIPVIAMTALALGEGSFLEATFDGYVGKPIDVRAFPDEVRRFAES
jgi:two-component system, cell cycle response regulator DivK